MSPGRFDSVLLLAFGGPTRPEEIRPFLDIVLRGRPVPVERYEAVVQHYIEVGGSSPLARLTESQAQGLRAILGREGPALPVFVGMRHWHPFVSDTMAQMAEQGLKRAVGVILAAHPSQASREAYIKSVSEAQRRIGEKAPALEFIEPFFDHPLFIEALVARLGEALASLPEDRRARARVLFTAHSIPVEMSDRSGYEASLRRTAELVAAAAPIEGWRLVFQSRSGNPSERWLEPDVCDALRTLQSEGAADAVVAPIGFVSDHVEVLYDLDIEARRLAQQIGLGFYRAGTAGEHPAFIGLLAALVRARVGRERAG